MYKSAIISILALSTTLAYAAPGGALRHAKRQLGVGAPGGPGGPAAPVVRVEVGVANPNAGPQNLAVTIVNFDNNSGSQNLGFVVNDVILNSADVAGSSDFTEASCFFSALQAQPDLDGNIQCDLDQLVGSGISSHEGTVVVMDAPAQCMFCFFS